MKLLKIVMATALLTTLSVAQKEALIVGVSDYVGTKGDLAGVKKDVVNMKVLFEQWGFHVNVLKDAQSMALEKQLSRFSDLGKDDNFIFYYSGHGYHIKDRNGDEVDGEDETLVLSDGTTNQLFLDDALFGYLNAIKAKKMVIFDACHSGTAFKTFGNKPKVKSMATNATYSLMKTKAFRPQESQIKEGEYIVLSASQDNEESLDTKNGGLFTTTFLKRFQNGGASERLMNLLPPMEERLKLDTKRSLAKQSF